MKHVLCKNESSECARPEHPQNRWRSIAVFVLIGVTIGAGCAQPPGETSVDSRRFAQITIAPLDEALTFARIRRDGAERVIAVTRYSNESVEGLDLSIALGRPVEDPVALFQEQGYGALRDLVNESPRAAIVSLPVNTLIQPLALKGHHVAAGVNYPEHAGETSVKDGPFLFPKLVDATGPYSRLSVGSALLDYEVELAWVPLTPLHPGGQPASMGVLIGNDYTDRATLLNHIDPDDIVSGKGFTTGKSMPGYLPVGNLFVIPRDFRAFANSIELRLYVNNRLRQQSRADEMIWRFDELLKQIWAQRSTTWAHRGEQISLTGIDSSIPEGTLILTGTPQGTVFQGLDKKHKLQGFSSWLFGGWDQTIAQHAISAYIRDMREARTYLQPGDEVVIHVDKLGLIRNQVTK